MEQQSEADGLYQTNEGEDELYAIPCDCVGSPPPTTSAGPASPFTSVSRATKFEHMVKAVVKGVGGGERGGGRAAEKIWCC